MLRHVMRTAHFRIPRRCRQIGVQQGVRHRLGFHGLAFVATVEPNKRHMMSMGRLWALVIIAVALSHRGWQLVINLAILLIIATAAALATGASDGMRRVTAVQLIGLLALVINMTGGHDGLRLVINLGLASNRANEVDDAVVAAAAAIAGLLASPGTSRCFHSDAVKRLILLGRQSGIVLLRGLL